MRLFRQRARDDLDPVFDEIAVAVEARAHARGHAGGDPDETPAGRPAAGALIAIPGAIGELIDKITILEIKESRIDDAAKLRNIRFELALLRKLKAEAGLSGAKLDRMEAELRRANETLWSVEDALRACETRGQFDDDFTALARQVYASNDQRASLKKKINLLFGSAIVEEKSYPDAR
jgi:hypothetical protein